MPRYLVRVEYDGTGFVGWQRQDNGPSVQAALENAAGAIIGGRQAVAVQGAGRTDAGVHATGQAAHLDLPDPFDPFKLPLALNAHLPDEVRVLSAREVSPDFHARFDAIGRAYRYRILTRRVASALERGRVWHVAADLDIAAMQQAAAHLTGRHDFTSFRAAQCQAQSPVRTLDVLSIHQEGEEVAIVAEARSFLHHQIRNITGTLVLVGKGKWHPDDVATALASRDRSAAGPTAPPEGLYLSRVDYPEADTVS
ncbi:tRNA pseudouridine(38-40) synthase TruA [Alphaproteobacteria bacterium LSUCC0684]